MNIIVLIGNISTDVVLRKTNNGVSYTKFGIAVKRPTRDNTADFINCTAWQKTAENLANFFRKGNKIAIKGSLNVNNYTDANNKPAVNYDVRVDEFYFIENKQQANSTQPEQQNSYNNIPYSDELGF